ncbi:hypothetical protein RUM43_001301 [Polyplax serrata]|uniref:Protease inhibitor n=1 Tax=Polyplax serrata TaxID=468196 RepID=A0AAN8XQF1_POLSC
MKYQIFMFVAVLLCTLLLTSEAQPTKVCEPGTTSKKDCNTCICNSDGTDMLCTKKECFEDEMTQADEAKGEDDAEKKAETKSEDKEEDKKEEEKSEDKPDCKSEDKEESKTEEKTDEKMADGTETKSAVGEEGKAGEDQEKAKSEDSDSCTPGQMFKKDCNDCTCPPSGLKSAGACTLLACGQTADVGA